MTSWTLSPDRADSWAVLVAVGRYDDLPDLPEAVASMELTADHLAGPDGCFAPERVVRLVDPRSADEVLERIAEVAGRARSALLLHYTGHGVTDANGRLQLALPGTRDDPERLAGTALPAGAALAALGRTAAHRVAVLDCRSAGLALDEPAAADLHLLTAVDRDGEPLLGEQPGLTRFAEELLRLLREGVPDGPAVLPLDLIHHHLTIALARPPRRARPPVPVPAGGAVPVESSTAAPLPSGTRAAGQSRSPALGPAHAPVAAPDRAAVPAPEAALRPLPDLDLVSGPGLASDSGLDLDLASDPGLALDLASDPGLDPDLGPMPVQRAVDGSGHLALARNPAHGTGLTVAGLRARADFAARQLAVRHRHQPWHQPQATARLAAVAADAATVLGPADLLTLHLRNTHAQAVGSTEGREAALALLRPLAALAAAILPACSPVLASVKDSLARWQG
ncbi:hypothetical protein ACIRBX_27750 [Kitasatospora sp. NPDC096147]|uniref:hypothetical protein n=1 Tax=Kitasatospora sp. NPDC096147 TaxID=3364093 RepID=UPI0038184BFA